MLHLVVTYDVVDDYKRTRLAKFLKGYLDHVQKSVFEGEIQEWRLEKLREGIRERIDPRLDSVRLYTLCVRCQGVTDIIGTGVYVEHDDDDLLL